MLSLQGHHNYTASHTDRDIDYKLLGQETRRHRREANEGLRPGTEMSGARTKGYGSTGGDNSVKSISPEAVS